jgi:hypothetical protein
MKQCMLSALVVILCAGGIGSALAGQDGATMERGKALFNDPSLGAAGKTCNDCHARGRGLEAAGERKDLPDIVNGCIVGPLRGKALKKESVEMRSLILYLKSIGAGKRGPLGC